MGAHWQPTPEELTEHEKCDSVEGGIEEDVEVRVFTTLTPSSIIICPMSIMA